LLGGFFKRFITSSKYVPARVTNRLPIDFGKIGVLLEISLQQMYVRSSSKKDTLAQVYMLMANSILMEQQFDHLVHYHFGLSAVLVQFLSISWSCGVLEGLW